MFMAEDIDLRLDTHEVFRLETLALAMSACIWFRIQIKKARSTFYPHLKLTIWL
jgi:hypothetical protein